MNKVLLVLLSAVYIIVLFACAGDANVKETMKDNISVEFDSSGVKTYKPEW